MDLRLLAVATGEWRLHRELLRWWDGLFLFNSSVLQTAQVVLSACSAGKSPDVFQGDIRGDKLK